MDLASKLSLPAKVVIKNQIPKSRLKLLPPSLPVYRYSGQPRSFPTNGLQMLLEQSAFKGTNLAAFPQGTNWNLALKNEKNPPDVFVVNSLRGDIRLENIERKTKIPEGDTVPGFKGIGRILLIMTESLDLPTDEMERSNNVVQMTFADTKRSVWSGVGMERILFIQSREAGIGRSILGYSSWLLDDKIAIKYGLDGQLLAFSVHWPNIEPVRTNKLLTIDALIEKIKRNQALTDSIDFPGSDVKTVTLKDIEIQYYYRPPSDYRGMMPAKTDMYPIASIFVTFKSKDGQTEDAGIYLPILESQ